MKEPHEHAFIDYILSEFTEAINSQSLHFFRTVLEQNPPMTKALPDKLFRLLNQLGDQLQAEHINWVIETIHQQKTLSKYPLSDLNFQLTTHQIPSIKPLEYTLHIINNLTLRSLHEPQYAGLKQIICWIAASSFDLDQPIQSLNKLTRSILEKFDDGYTTDYQETLTHWIQFIIVQLHLLAGVHICGTNRTMDLFELYFILEEMAKQAGILNPSQHDGLIADINTIMLIMGVCRHNPSALYDIVALTQMQTKHIMATLHNRYRKNPLLETFLNGQHFHPYFGQRSNAPWLSQHAFLMTLNDCVSEHIVQIFEHHDIETCTKLFLNQIESLATQRLTQVGRLIFVTNKLIGLGFQPRSAIMAAQGSFQPLISPDTARLDANNLKAFKQFWNQLNTPTLKKQFIQEVMTAIKILRYPTTPVTPKTESSVVYQCIKPAAQKAIVHRQRLFSKTKKVSPQPTTQSIPKVPLGSH